MNSIEKYILEFPEPIQDRLNQIYNAIKEVVPADAESKISYNMPTIYYKKNLVHFAAFKNHIGFYPLPNAIAEFDADLKKYKHAKGSIQFQHSEELPIDLIKRIVEFRLKEVNEL